MNSLDQLTYAEKSLGLATFSDLTLALRVSEMLNAALPPIRKMAALGGVRIDDSWSKLLCEEIQKRASAEGVK